MFRRVPNDEKRKIGKSRVSLKMDEKSKVKHRRDDEEYDETRIVLFGERLTVDENLQFALVLPQFHSIVFTAGKGGVPIAKGRKIEFLKGRVEDFDFQLQPGVFSPGLEIPGNRAVPPPPDLGFNAVPGEVECDFHS
jgi:hypothetical protein